MKSTIENRKKIVQQATANQTLEGLEVSKHSVEISKQYIAGKITAKQAASKIKARYGSI